MLDASHQLWYDNRKDCHTNFYGEKTVVYQHLLLDLDKTLMPYDKDILMPGRKKLLTELRNLGVKMALVTNQGGIACGYTTLEAVRLRFAKLQIELGFLLDDIYYCPHYPQKIGPKIIENLIVDNCYDRKPNPGMLAAAMIRFEAPKAIMVGDSNDDVGAVANYNKVYPNKPIEFVYADLFFDLVNFSNIVKLFTPRNEVLS
jgi:HAD superfamily hydrolase (TIGR01662 family)